MRSFPSTYKFFEKRDGRIIVFRSWLESKWAYIFDCLGLEWVYEPAIIQLENYKSYIPDFFIKGIGFLEIKPDVITLVNENLDQLKEASFKIGESPSHNKLISLSSFDPSFGIFKPSLAHLDWINGIPHQLSRYDFLSILYSASKILQKRGLVDIDPILEGLITQSKRLKEPIVPTKHIMTKLIYKYGTFSTNEAYRWDKDGILERKTISNIVNGFINDLDNEISSMYYFTA